MDTTGQMDTNRQTSFDGDGNASGERFPEIIVL